MISKFALKVLTFVKNNKGATHEELETQFTGKAYMSALEHLKSLGYVNQNIPNLRRKLHYTDYQLARAGTYYITEKGVGYIEAMKEYTFDRKLRIIHDWVNTAIALAALVLSIIALAK